MEPAKSTMCTLIRKTVLKSSGVSSNENFKLGGKLVCTASKWIYHYFNSGSVGDFVQLKYNKVKYRSFLEWKVFCISINWASFR